MPWCPKCRSEYRQGFTVCADCGCELVEEEPVKEQPADVQRRQPAAESMQILKAEERVDDGTYETEQLNEADTARSALGSSSLYQSNSQRADENRSSAWVLLIVGLLGIIAVVLGIMGVLPLKMANPYLFYGVMGAIFILFLVAGIVSMKNAKIFSQKAESENSLRNTMLDWCRQNLNGQEIDKKIGSDNESEEVRYFKRMAYLREKLNHQFINLDQDFLEQFIDDQVYDMIFVNDANVNLGKV